MKAITALILSGILALSPVAVSGAEVAAPVVQAENYVPSSKVKISDTFVELKPGETYKLKLTGLKKGKKAKWKSYDKSIATVNKKGVVKAVSDGVAVIQANYYYECVVKVSSGTEETPFTKMADYVMHEGELFDAGDLDEPEFTLSYASYDVTYYAKDNYLVFYLESGDDLCAITLAKEKPDIFGVSWYIDGERYTYKGEKSEYNKDFRIILKPDTTSANKAYNDLANALLVRNFEICETVLNNAGLTLADFDISLEKKTVQLNLPKMPMEIVNETFMSIEMTKELFEDVTEKHMLEFEITGWTKSAYDQLYVLKALDASGEVVAETGFVVKGRSGEFTEKALLTVDGWGPYDIVIERNMPE